jgi:hypothetical protein
MTARKKKEIRSLLEWVKKQILAQPKKYNQSSFVGSYLKEGTCETVGCIAGCIDVRLNGTKVHIRRLNGNTVWRIASNAINSYGSWLFTANFRNKLGPIKQPGTKAAARQAARAIDMYLKEIGA